MRLFLTVVASIMLVGCASTAMKRHVGSSISEAYMSYGRPANVFDLPDGRRAFQFYWGGGAIPVAGHSTSTINPTLTGYQVTTTGTPAMLLESEGCLVTLIARPTGADFIVEEYRIPKRAVC